VSVNTGEPLSPNAWLALTYAVALPLGLWYLATLALSRIGPWKGDPRTWKLAGLLVGTGFCLLFVLMFVWAFGLQEGGATANANAHVGLAVALIGLATLGFLAYRLDRDIRHPKSHA
jgi:hypothetical protein